MHTKGIGDNYDTEHYGELSSWQRQVGKSDELFKQRSNQPCVRLGCTVGLAYATDSIGAGDKCTLTTVAALSACASISLSAGRAAGRYMEHVVR